MHNAALNFSLRENSRNGIWKLSEPITLEYQ